MTEPPASTSPASTRPGLFGNLSTAPDWSSDRALIAVALVVWLIACVVMAKTNNVLPGFRDTDDATRLEMVRNLLAGQGWYDQAIHRFDPPAGLWMHWSRLLDGALVAMVAGFRLFMPQPSAEYWTRFFWPLLWILPGVIAGLALARNLGGRTAVIIGAVLMVTTVALYRQFYPGRIDHHDVQIVMCVIALAGATARENQVRWSIVGGAAAAFGIAVGLEAMLMQALVGASYGVALILGRRAARRAMAYGLTLAGTVTALFMIQTPPWRWGMGFCDVLAFNLLAAIVVAGAGLALVASLSAKAPDWFRAVMVAVVGAVSLGVYLAIDPACIHGPFAGVSPIVKEFWLDRVQEIQPLPAMMKLSRGAAIAALVMSLMSLAAAVFLAVRLRREAPASAALILAAALMASVIAWFAWRMQDYVYWVGVPALAAAFSLIAGRWLRDLLLPTLVVAILVSPVSLSLASNAVTTAVTARPVKLANGKGAVVPPPARLINAGPRCFAGRIYAPLAALPPGDVLAPQDLGPFILVYTPDSAVTAPYHRMWPVILRMHQAFAATPTAAEALVRDLHADYVVDCPPYPLAVGAGSLGDALRHGRVPPWLKPLSAPKAVLKIYKVLPTP